MQTSRDLQGLVCHLIHDKREREIKECTKSNEISVQWSWKWNLNIERKKKGKGERERERWWIWIINMVYNVLVTKGGQGKNYGDQHGRRFQPKYMSNV